MNREVVIARITAIILFLSLGGITEPVLGQTLFSNSEIDADTSLVNTLIDSSFSLSYSHPDRAIAFADSALQLAKQSNYLKGKARAHRELGYSNGVKGNFETALSHHQKGVALHRQISDTLGIISQLNDIGNLYMRQSKYEKALENFFQSLELSESILMDRATASILGNIGLSRKYI